MQPDPGSWIRRYHPAADDAPRLVCFPHAGGSASYFFPVSGALSPGVEVLALQYPGRQDRRREAGPRSVAEFVDLIVPELRPWTDRPTALFGHSLGASIAFEVARRLTAEGVPPVRLFASGRRSPTVHRSEAVHLADDAALLAELRALSGTDAALLEDEEVVRAALPSLRSDYTAAETYVYDGSPAPLSCPVTALVGDVDPRVGVEDARAWSDVTRGAFELCIFPGGHFYLTEHAPSVIRLVADRLAPIRA